MIRKDYLGEAHVSVEDWFAEGRAVGWAEEGNVVRLIVHFGSGRLMLIGLPTAFQRDYSLFPARDQCDRHCSAQTWLRCASYPPGVYRFQGNNERAR